MMSIKAVLTLCFNIYVFLSFANSCRAEDNVLETTVCVIVSQPQQFDQRIVRFKALVLSDGLEGTVLFDSQCPEKGIELYVGSESSNDKGWIALWDAIFRGRPGTRGKEIAGTFTGKFVSTPNKVPSRTLIFREVTDLQVKLPDAQ